MSRLDRVRTLAAALALAPGLALAGVRPAPGGSVTLALPAEARIADPALAQDAADLVLARATSAPLLERDAGGRLVPGVLAEVPTSEDGGRTWRLRVRDGLVTAAGAPLGAAEVAAAVARLLSRAPASPHAWAALALLGADGVLAGRAAAPEGLRVVSARELVLTLALPLPELPDLLAALPLAVAGAGPFVLPSAPARGAPWVLRANPAAPGGRPFLDALALQVVDARAAARLLARGKVELVLRPERAGDAAGPALPPLRATVAALGPGLGPRAAAVRAALASVDRAALARRFARGAAVPLSTLVPPALLAVAAVPASAPNAPGASAPGRLRILVRGDAADPRAIADRLQVTLFDRGITAAVDAVDRERFAARLAAGDYELALVEVQVLAARPALAAAQIATAVRGPAAGRRALGALAGLDGAPAAAAAERLARELDLVPLVATAPRASAAPALQGIAVGPEGLLDPGALWLLGGEAHAP
ncbi:ABC transporter substrate-binding protein [Anaeromyxobacter soli]|uniref:ABC transporter substrate-binding protein n=1 Tax=Anaeromyxobacter soli TaxID=2922725 RepID=UPI001FAFE401|nr:ABC transporter substrate-binding protein [Anaeromyxobacter sp. SG29]